MKEKRIIAFFIDYFITIFIVTIFALLMVFSQKIINPEQGLILASFLLPFILIAELYLMFRDLICGGQSIGKRVVKIKIMDSNSVKVSTVRLMLYDITVIVWPLEAILLLSKGRTIGEKIAKVQILEV